MGSLPNLHELEKTNCERKLHHGRRERRLRELRESNRDRDKFPIFVHPTTQFHCNPHLLVQTFAGFGAPAAISGTVVPSNIIPVATGTAIIGFGTPGQIPKYHHRHSLTARRVLRTRSSGASYNIWDDSMLERLSAYSPISTRSHRINAVSSYQVQAALAASRRKESLSSSIGANSIRRLLTLNNRSCRHKIPQQVRENVTKHFTFLAVAHGLICAILVPLMAIQGSNSTWHHRELWVNVGPNIGSLLLSISFIISSGMCLLTTRILQKMNYTIVLVSNNIGIFLFLLCHLYPSIYTLIPAYILLGITLGPACVGKYALVVYFGSKLSCSQHDCTFGSAIEPHDDQKIYCNRDQKVRRLVRWYQAAQNFGIMFGAIIAAIILACSSTDCLILGYSVMRLPIPTYQPPVQSIENNVEANVTANLITTTIESNINLLSSELNSDFFDDMYNHNEQGQRICGADLCPVWQITIDEQLINQTFYSNFLRQNSKISNMTLIIIFIVFSIIAFTLSCLLGRIETIIRKDRIKGITDTLLFAGPMAYFIGTEQAYMLGDFMRAFVSCSLGLQMVAGALIGMGIMQLIVSCTLSMLLRHTKRIVVIIAGFIFHACLLLVLSRWKPSKDDSALFYVIAASWGACNGMWETLLLALVTLTHTNNVAGVEGPLQALRFLGLGITFAAHGFLCENPKILILVIVLVLSIVPYTMLEIRLEAQRKAKIVTL